ncbi:MAG: S9 family peptidase [Dysgonamonadaceae bacterium]|jgi:dipeptidyl aminopeptidase/acylaminoacyl peptidase|nr:S9 family peptidase [Dysgonamonadaceae bacterium]
MKTNLFIFLIMAVFGLTSCCQSTENNENTENLIGKSNITITDGIMTPEVLYSFGRVGSPVLSSDGEKVLYAVTYVGIEENKTNTELFIMSTDGSDNKQITKTPKSEANAVWLENGKKIAFLKADENGNTQIFIMNADGNKVKQISSFEQGIDGFKFSPNEQKIAFVAEIKSGNRTSDIYPDLPKATGRIVNNLMYKHWNEWVETIPHIFVADYKNNELQNITDILEGEPYEAPMKPFSGIEQFDWHPDGQKIAYSSKKKIGVDYARSTNSDIYLYDIETKTTINLTEGMMGYDTNPAFSPDGQKMAWLSMERDGYESDKNRLFVIDLQSNEKTYLTENFDYNADDFCWDFNSQNLYFVSCVEAKTQLFSVDLFKNIKALTSGQHDYVSVAYSNGKLYALRQSLSSPREIFSVDIATKEEKQLTTENKHILDQLTMGKVEERWINTTDNKKMLTWIVYPPNFDANKKYPAILYCQGGPQNTVSQFWSYRWNLQIMAANGYIIVAPNRRGLPGFGQEWLEQISGDYGGQNMSDYFSAIDAMSKEPFIDETRLGCTGASYGGFSVYWLAGNHNNRFKAFFSHAGIFNLESQYLETEEMWFADWDLGGPFWDKNNAVAQKSYANSPHRFVQNWNTPIMISHGELDFRILASQGMMAFNAAQLRGIPSRMLIYPNENHWITRPQNGILFQREFFRWFDEWLK